jgi:hypothetical protein
MMHIERPRVQWAPGVLRIVMLVASDLIGCGVSPLHHFWGAIIAVYQSVRSATVLRLLQTSFLRPAQRAPTFGPVRRSDRLPGEFLLPPGGSNGRSQVSPSGRRSCEPRSLPASVQCFCSAFSWSRDLFQAFLPHFPAHVEPTDNSAPLAASAVR